MPPRSRTADTSRARGALARTAPANGAAVTPNGGVTLEQKIRGMEAQLQLAMPRGAEAKQLVRDALTALRQVPNLAKCDHTTVLGALMRCAQLGLRPGPSDLVHLVPFWNRHRRIHEAQIVVDYKGYIHLAHNAGTVVRAHSIHANDHVDVEYGLDDRLVHKPPPFGVDRGPVLGYYAVAKWATGHAYILMTKQEVEDHRDKYSKAWAKDGERSIWGTNPDSMGKKTCVRELRKWMPMSTEMLTALAVDGQVHTETEADSLDVLPPLFDDPNVIDAEPVDDPPAEPAAPPAAPPAELAPVDPNTGEITDPAPPDEPPDHARQLREQAAASWSDDGQGQLPNEPPA